MEKKFDKLKLTTSLVSLALVIILLTLPKCSEDKAKQNLENIKKNMPTELVTKLYK